jgi:hypothetical protein
MQTKISEALTESIMVWICEDGRYHEAKRRFLPILISRHQNLEQGDPTLLKSMSLMVPIYRNQGKWTDAEELGVRVLNSRKEFLASRILTRWRAWKISI